MAELLIETRGAIEIATLNRPEALNALSESLTDALVDYFDGLHRRPEIRVVILNAAGRAFCAGLDLKGWKTPGKPTIANTLAVQTKIGNIYRRMRSCPQPIIACAQGAACGGGFSLLLASDVRYGAENLKMNAAYIKIGLGGADMASSYLLPRLVGRSLASELLLTGRFLHADRALRLGLLSNVVEAGRLLDVALELAADMLATTPHGLRLTKQALELNTDAPSMEAAMALEDRQQVMMSAMEDFQEAKAAFLEKRPADFRGG
jgi:enoyl-CoA hydratase/carnithine racemase